MSVGVACCLWKGGFVKRVFRVNKSLVRYFFCSNASTAFARSLYKCLLAPTLFHPNFFLVCCNFHKMQYPNTHPNTKMTRQLVGPIEVVLPKHSSDDRNHEFQIASQMNACIEFSKAEYARFHQSRIRTLHYFSSFIQICTKPEAFLAHQPKIQDISTFFAPTPQ